MPIYNKLVRDRMPEIIERSGKTYTNLILSNQKYIEELRKISL
jgi:predicted house-cleaning noncanonical NTP pyrophosphatase (MazG superfamily)